MIRPLGFMTNGGAPPPSFVLADLPLSLFCEAAFAGVPWAGRSSAAPNASNGRDLDEATNPPSVGATLNGYAVVELDGINQQLTNATTFSTVCPDAAASIGCLFYADAAAVDPGASAYYQNPSFLVNAVDGYAGFGFNDAGICLGSYDTTSGTFNSVYEACSVGAWHFAQGRWDNSAGGGAGLMEVRVDGGAWQPLVKLVEASLSAGGLNVGTSFSNAFFFAGKIASIWAAPLKLGDADFDDVRGYYLNKFGV